VDGRVLKSAPPSNKDEDFAPNYSEREVYRHCPYRFLPCVYVPRLLAYSDYNIVFYSIVFNQIS
jgi:hypothetical protein